MKELKKILICGLGAIGGYYASKIFENKDLTLKILTDKNRLARYKKEPRIINGKEYSFDYILPDNNGFKPDLIIIATKAMGLDDAIKNIKNFVNNECIILSFLNGITSEDKITNAYGDDKTLYSYLLGHTFFRKGNIITHDGNAKIIFGANNKNDPKIEVLTEFFDKINVKYEVSDNIKKSLWEKFTFNCCANQVSALTRKTFGEIKKSNNCITIMKNICNEVTEIARAEGIDSKDFWNITLKSLDLMIPDGKTSMLQDVESGNKTEVDIFGKTVTRLGEKHNISTPYNKVISEIIESLHA